MKRFSMILGAVALVAAITPTTAQVDTKVKAELTTSYGKVMAALKKKDVKGVMSMITDDAKMIEQGQTMTKAQVEVQMQQQLKLADFVSSKLTFTKVVVKGKEAHCEYGEDIVMMVPGPDGKKAKMEIASKNKAIFRKVGSDWKMAYGETLGKPVMKMNGKPVAAPGG